MFSTSESKLLLFALLCFLSFVTVAQEIESQVLIGDPNVTSTRRARIVGKISGKAERAGLFSATVSIQGTNIGAVTDQNGNYEFTVNPCEYVLIVQFLGKKHEELLYKWWVMAALI